MSIVISPIITDVGLGVFQPLAVGVEFTFTHVAVGTGTSPASSGDTALENEVARFPIAGGGVNAGGKSVTINAIISNHTNMHSQNYDISEFGFFGVDGNGDTLLFMVYRQNTRIINKVSGVDIAIPFSLGLSSLPVSNITVELDTNIAAMLALLGQHTSLNHPHTQYKRTNDNSERLKISDAVAGDEAASKNQLDVEGAARANGDMSLAIALAGEITARTNADANLQTQINNLTLAIMSKAWPIGSVYENAVDGRNPSHADLLGFGTWIPYAEGETTFGYKSGDVDFGTLGQSGGAKGHKMTLDNLIAHGHNINLPSAGTGSDVGGFANDGANDGHSDYTTDPTGEADPDPIPTIPPYVVSAKWQRTA